MDAEQMLVPCIPGSVADRTWISDTGSTGAPAPTFCFLNSILYNSNLDPGQEGAMGHAENTQDTRAMPNVAGQ